MYGGKELTELIDGMDTNGLLQHSHMLTGAPLCGYHGQACITWGTAAAIAASSYSS